MAGIRLNVNRNIFHIFVLLHEHHCEHVFAIWIYVVDAEYEISLDFWRDDYMIDSKLNRQWIVNSLW